MAGECDRGMLPGKVAREWVPSLKDCNFSSFHTPLPSALSNIGIRETLLNRYVTRIEICYSIFLKGESASIQEKGDLSDCNNYRGISCPRPELSNT